VTLSRLRQDARSIFDAGLKAADPYASVVRSLSDHPLPEGAGIVLVGAGKATHRMAEAAEHVLGDRIVRGWINVKDGHRAPLRRTHQHECAHPVPDERGVEGARAIVRLADEAAANDVVLCLISGGASALMPLPAEGLGLEDKQRITRQLLRCGATIQEINAVRKHLSSIKGGQLARRIAPAAGVSLILSDVIGDPLDVIGSGPTAPDCSTREDAREILARYGIGLEAAVVRHLKNGVETPKPGDAAFDRIENRIIGSNALALEAASSRALELGYRVVPLGSDVQGEARDEALRHVGELERHGAGVCLLSGGECTVTVRGAGKGGRNQEFVLAAVRALARLDCAVMLSAGTDGTDGPTDAAGAIADSESLRRAAHLDPDEYLARNDSYRFFEALNDLVMTGPTGTNVMDLRVVLAG
jgi:hydroxypyruvate reductase